MIYKMIELAVKAKTPCTILITKVDGEGYADKTGEHDTMFYTIGNAIQAVRDSLYVKPDWAVKYDIAPDDTYRQAELSANINCLYNQYGQLLIAHKGEKTTVYHPTDNPKELSDTVDELENELYDSLTK